MTTRTFTSSDPDSPTGYSTVTVDADTEAVVSSTPVSPKLSTETWHRVEQTAKVYLLLSPDGTEWEIDEIIDQADDDGIALPLDGSEDGPLGSECECEDQDAHVRVENAAWRVPVPTPLELLHLLADHLGYDLAPKGR